MILRKTCKISGKEFSVSRDEIDFCENFAVPTPTYSPNERLRQRLAVRNFRNLYKRKCDFSGNNIISTYDSSVPFPVYDVKHWWSDHWDPQSYAKDFDFSKPFFTQFKELRDSVPHAAVMNSGSENCRFTNYCIDSKNCYLVFGCIRSENCLYGHVVWESENCIDCTYTFRCQWSSNSTDIVDCYDVHYSTESTNCNESYFLYDCKSCTNCFGCFNLRNSRYCFFNQQLSKEQYKQAVHEFFPLTHSKIDSAQTRLRKEQSKDCIYPPFFGVNNENVTGNHIYESKNLHNCFDSKRTEDSAHCFTVMDNFNSYDISFGPGSRYSYFSVGMGNSERVLFSHIIHGSNDITYSDFCYSSHDLFGCTQMRNSKYCILNKQYSKDDYHNLKNKITEHMKSTGEWGEFFPMSLSSFAYNKSAAYEYLPLEKEEVLNRGWRWQEEAKGQTPNLNTLELPDDINKVKEDILEKQLSCQESGKRYKILPIELELRKKMGIPIPKTCPDARYLSGLKLRGPRILDELSCAKCNNKFLSPHSTEKHQSKVLCGNCYLDTIH